MSADAGAASPRTPAVKAVAMAVAKVIFFIVVLPLVSIPLFETVVQVLVFESFETRSVLFNGQLGALISGWQDLIANWQQSTVAVESHAPLGV
jgi:hypothetical protein